MSYDLDYPRKPKIDRIACPWLIRRFIDPDAQILFVLTDPALHAAAPIVRGADTDNHALAQQTAGLWAISAGLAYNIRNDHELLATGMLIYDALCSWATHLQHEKYTQNPVEKHLIQVVTTYLQAQKVGRKRKPVWISELEALIQDHIDTNRASGPAAISLKSVSQAVQMNPTYLSREFAAHFDNLTFGEYIRKLRIEKAVQLLDDPANLLLDIVYLTGFSDQSHFTRIFKKHTGKSPSVYRKARQKGKSVLGNFIWFWPTAVTRLGVYYPAKPICQSKQG